MSAGIYQILSPTGRVYVGQSWNIERRWRQHRNDRGDGLLQRSFRKHGPDQHELKIILPLPAHTSADVLNEAERYFITLFTERGVLMLNLTEGGRNARMSPEQKEKIRQALKGHKRTPEHRANISKSKKGIPKPESYKAHLRATMKGRPATWLKGKRLSAEHVEKIRAASMGRKHSDEFKRTVSARNRRIQDLLHSDEARQRRREKMTGRTLPPEQREKMRLAQLRRWERWRTERER